MSMYKNIFVNEDWDASSTNIQGINGEILMFGETAFSSVEQAVAAVGDSGAIVIKVASGKYDSFGVITPEGEYRVASSVVAVDFDGGEAMIGGEVVTVADSGLGADAQASIIADLNSNTAANGKIFVSSEFASDSTTTLYVGMGDSGYVAGASAAVVYGNGYGEIVNSLGDMYHVDMAANDSTTVNVLDGGTQTVSFTSTPHSVVGTVAAGGTLKSVAVPNRGDSIVAVGGLTVGSADSDKKAFVDFKTERVLSVKISKGSGTAFVTNNAEVKIGDLWWTTCNSKSSFTNTDLYIDGVLAVTGSTVTFDGSDVYVTGNRKNSSVTPTENIISRATLTNTTITFDDKAEGSVHSAVLLGYKGGSSLANGKLTMINSTIQVEQGASVKIDNEVTMSNGSKLVGGNLELADGKLLKLDSSCLLTLDSLTGSGKIELTLLEGFAGGKIIDITGETGLTDDILSKITLKGATENLSAKIVDGDIFIVGPSADLEFKDEEKATLTDKVVAQDVTVTNSKELAVTGGINALDSATITNAKVEGEKEGKLNGGYDADGKELAAKITAENNIVLQNDGHANVDLDAKKIIIANNSKNTLIGNIGTADTENVVIADGKATADGVTIDGNGVVDGAVKNATITADTIQISGQEVTNTAFNTPSLHITGDAALGAGNTYTNTSLVRPNIFLGSKENSVNATLDVTDDNFGNIVAANGTVTLTGKMDETLSQGPQLDVGGFLNPGGIGPKDLEMGSTTVNIAEDAYIKTHQVYIGENESVNDHTLNVYGQLDATASVFNKAKGELNVYGEMNVADQKYLQAAGDVTVSGENASLNVGGVSNYGIKIGTDEDGLRSEFTVENGASVNVGTIVNVGYNTTRNGDLNVNGGNFSAGQVVVQSGSTFNVSGDSSLNIGSLTGAAAIVGDAKLTDSNVGGKVSVGFDAENAADTTLTLAGDTDITTLYVGKEGRENDYKLSISGEDADVTLGNLYNRTDSVVEVTDGATANIGYWQSKGSVLIDDATVNHTGVNMYVYNNDSTSAAEIKLTNGATLNSDANYAIYLGNSEGGPAKGNAKITLESGSTLNTKNLTLHADGVVEEVAGEAAKTSVSVTDSTLNVTGTMTNNGTVTVAGESTLNIATLTGDNVLASDGAVIKDSTIGGAGLTANGDVTFKGDNKLGSFSMGYFGHDVSIGADASLETTGTGRLTLAYANTLDVDGTIVDAKSADKTAVKKSLNILGGVSITGAASYGEANNGAVLDVDNAYISLGSTTSKNSAATGDFVLDFNNSIVEFTKDFQTAASTAAGLDPNFQLNVKDSVVTVADRFAFSHENSTAVIDNSTFTITKQFKNAGEFTLQNGSVMSVGDNSDGYSYEKTGNFGTLNINDSTLTHASTSANPFYNAGSVNVNGGSFDADFVKNDGAFNVAGESTLNVDNFTGNAIAALDGTTLADSVIKGGQVVAGGDIAFKGDNTFTTLKNTNGGVVSVEEGKTLNLNNFSFGSSASADAKYVIEGGKIVANYGFFQHGEYTLAADFETGYMYYSYGSNITVTGNFHSKGAGDGLDYVRGNLTIAESGTSVHDKSLWVGQPASWGAMSASLTVNGLVQAATLSIYSGSSLTITDGNVIAGTLNNEGGSITLNVTDEKLASLGGSAYYMVNQTGSGAALNLGVSYNGTVYNIGDSITIGDIVYHVTNGDGNDIAIEAKATVLTVDSEIQANGFNKFNNFRDAVTTANANGGAIINLTDEAYVYADALPDSAANNLLITEAGNYTITGGNGLLVNYELEVNPDKADGNYSINFADANVTMTKLTFRDSVTATINDSVVNFKGYLGNGTMSGPSYLSVYRDSTLEINNSTVGLDISRGDGKFDDLSGTTAGDGINNNWAANWAVYGSLSVTDSTIYAGPSSGSDSFSIKRGGSVTLKDSTANVVHFDVGYSGAEDKKLNPERTTEAASLTIDNSKVYNNMYSGDQSSMKTGLFVGSSANDYANKVEIINGSVVDLTVNGVKNDGLIVGNAQSSVSVESGSQLIVSKADNSGSVSVDKSTLQIDGTLTNNGSIDIAGSEFSVGSITGTRLNADDSALININASVDENGNNVATTLNIANGFEQVIDVNRNGAAGDKVILTGNVNASSTANSVIRTFNDVEVSGFKENVGAANPVGKFFADGNITIKDNSDININWFQIKGNGVIEEGSTVSAPNVNIYDHSTLGAVTFTVNGNLKADTLIITNSIYKEYYKSNQYEGDSNFIVGETGVIDRATSGASGRFDLQLGQMTVYGYVNQNWNSTGGTAYIGNDGYSTTLTIDGTYAAADNNKGKFVNSGTQTMEILEGSFLNVVNGGTFDWAGKIDNAASINVDADSKFIAGSVVNTGSINSNKANTAEIIGDFTVAGNFSTGDLIINADGSLTAGSITVDNLTLSVGGSLSLTGSGSSIAADYITVTGAIATAEYQLVLNGWTGDLLGKEIKFDANGDGTIAADEIFTVKSDVTNLSGVNFVAQGGKLYVKDFGADATTIYIGDLTNAVDGKITIDGVTYTVGEDAFATASEAAAVVDADNLTEITVGNGDHINEVAANFGNIGKIIVPAGTRVEDSVAAEFDGDLVIENDGHLKANISAAGQVTMTNTSSNTFTGSLVGEDVDVINTATGTVTAATLEANAPGGGMLSVDNQGVIENTKFVAVDGMVDVKGEGTFTNVDVTADTLYLNGLDFTLDGDSSVNSIYMDQLISAESGKLTLDGASVGIVYSSGTGEVEFTGATKLDNVSIENVDTVTLSGGTHQFSAITDIDNKTPLYYMNNLNIGSAEFNWIFSNEQELDYNVGTPIDYDQGMIKVNSTDAAAVLNFKQTGAYDLKDLDVSNFGGAVNIASSATLDLEDATDYFKDGAVLDVDGVLNLKGTGTFANTGMDFNGDGDINVMTDHKFTAAEALNGFTGDLSIGDDNTLTLGKANDTDAIFHGNGDVIAEADLTLGADTALNDFRGNIQADTKVVLDGVNETAATFSGEGTVDVQKDQILSSDDAISNVEGTLNAAAKLTLDGENSIQAALTGDGDILANADQDFTGNVSAFTGSYEAAAAKTVTFAASSTLASDMELNGAGKFVLATDDKSVNITSDSNATELDINNNNVTLKGGTFGDINGVAGSELLVAENAAAKDVTVEDVAVADNKTFTAGKVTVTDLAVGNAANMTAGDVTASNDITIGNAATVTAGNVSAADITIGDAATVGVADVTASNITLGDSAKMTAGNVSAADIIIGDEATVGVADVTASNITLGASASMTAGDVTASADITLGASASMTAGKVAASDLTVQAGAVLSAADVTASNTYIYIANNNFTGASISVTDASSFGAITVDSWSSEFKTPYTLIDSVNGTAMNYGSNVTFSVDSGDTLLAINGIAKKIDGNYVRVYTVDNDLLIGNYKGESNVVYVNRDWSSVEGTVYKWIGIDGTTDRIIDLDASKTLERAVEIIRAEDDGKGSIYLVKGGAYSTPAALMTAENEVKELVITADEVDSTKAEVKPGDVTIRGGVVAMESAGSGSLTLNNVSVSGNVYGGASVTGNAGSAADSTTLTLNGGAYQASNIVGGSYVKGGNYTVGSSELVIKNDTGAAMAITGRVIGGSMVSGSGSVVQESASVVIDTNDGKISVRGDIYAAGSGNVSVENSSVTFTGDAANLTFTGRVSGQAYNNANAAENSNLVFAGFNGEFKGLIQGFDTITVSGDSALSFSRKQTLTADTDFVFNVTSETLNNSAAPGQAMFTVNSFGWTYGDTISVNADASLAAGTYVLVNNWDSAYDVDFTINGVVGQNIVSGNRGFSIGESSNGKLYLQVKELSSGKFSAGAGVTAMDNVTVGSGSGDALSFGLGSEEVVTSGNTVIDGNVNAPYSEANTFTVAGGNTKVNGDFNLSYGDDTLNVKAGAEMEITGDLTLGNGNNDLVVGEGAEVTVKGDANFGGGTAKNIIALEKGAVMNVEGGFSTGTTGTGSALVMDVDSMLNNSNGYGNKPVVAVEGVGSLTSDKAGAKAIVNALDWGAEANTSREYSIDGVKVERDAVTQIAGAATAETSDDVFAALTKVDNSLVVSWGRTEVEAGAALDALEADSTLTLGEALVAVDDSLLDGFDSTDNLNKKSNGTLA